MRRRRTSSTGKKPQGPLKPAVVIRPYLDLLAALEKRLARAPAQTALDYAGAVAESDGSLADFLPLTRSYYEVRFNACPWTDELEVRTRRLRAVASESAASQASSH